MDKGIKLRGNCIQIGYEYSGFKLINCQALQIKLIKKYADPLSFSPLEILAIDSLKKWGGDKILLLEKKD